jgi:cytochrome b561
MKIETKEFNLTHRLLHWFIAFAILFLMLTVFLRLTWLEKNNVASILQDNLKALKIDLNHDDAIKIAKQIRKPMWDWHIYTGYFLIALYLLRMINLFKIGIIFPNPFVKSSTLKQKVQGWTYLIFYFLMGISLLTGLLIVKGPEDWGDFLEDIHVQSIYYVILFIIMHMVGLVLAELSNQKGIISKMIHGKEENHS